jgi:hypothetical protein
MAQRPAVFVTAILAASSIAACSGDGAGLTGASLTSASITNYEPSSLFSPAGHSVAALPDGRFRITAAGSATTPTARVEKIAMARAAEYGVESGHKFFRTEAPQFSIICGKRERVDRGQMTKIPPRGYGVVVLDVTYAKDPVDPSFRPTKATAEALKAEIAGEVPAPEAQSEIKSRVDAQCGT